MARELNYVFGCVCACVFVRLIGDRGVGGMIAHIIFRVGQNRVYTLRMTKCLVISVPKIPCMYTQYMYGSG